MRRLLERVGLLAVVMLMPAVALAQMAPPEPKLSESRAANPLLGYFFMFALLIVVITISMMPSKRSHQD